MIIPGLDWLHDIIDRSDLLTTLRAILLGGEPYPYEILLDACVVVGAIGAVLGAIIVVANVPDP